MLWWKGQPSFLDKLQRLQNTAIRKMLGAFRSSPSAAMEVEASIPPPKIRLNRQSRNFAIRVINMHETHPIRHRTPLSYPPGLDTGYESDPEFQEWDEPQSRDFQGRYETQLIRVLATIRDILPGTPRVENIDIDL